MLKRIALELLRHAPFTLMGAVTGIIIIVAIEFSNTPGDVSLALFYILHPLHIVFSALVTTAIYRLHKKSPILLTIIIGYTGSVGVATISDAIIPYLGGSALQVSMEFHLPFIESELIPFIGVPEWIAVSTAAAIGIALAYWKPATKFPHMVHVLLSTWASLFGFIALGITDWIPLLPFVFLFLFLAVWLPCCFSDIVYPLLWVGKEANH